MLTLEQTVATPLRTAVAWELTLHDYEHCAENDLSPIATQGYPALGSEPEGCGYYRPHSFLFQTYPLGVDFLRLVQHLPWLDHATSQRFRDAAVKCWPMLGMGKKAEREYVYVDDDTTPIGEIEIRRQTIYIS